MPHVCVIIPTWNRAERLSRAIESVLEQTYRDLELWVVDDSLREQVGFCLASVMASLDVPVLQAKREAVLAVSVAG